MPGRLHADDGAARFIPPANAILLVLQGAGLAAWIRNRKLAVCWAAATDDGASGVLPVVNATGQGIAYASGTYAFMVDNQDMTITIGVAGNPPSAIQLGLLTGGYITLKPQSVDISYYISPTVSGSLFGFNASNQYTTGFDQGSWGNVHS